MKSGHCTLPSWLPVAALAAAAAAAAVLPARADYQATWTDGGVPAAPSPNHYQADVRALPDGQGGAFLAWTEYESYDPATGWTQGRIRAQHLDGTGQPLWAAGGVDVSLTGSEQESPSIASDGQGGIVVAWDQPSGQSSDIYAQRLSSTGSQMWTGAGTAVCTAKGIQQHPVVCSDGSGGGVIAWEDLRNSVGLNTVEQIYAQHVASNGTVTWTADGVPVQAASGIQFGPYIAPYGSGGALVAYTDNGTTNVADVKAVPLSGAGAAGSTVVVCNAAGDQVLNDLRLDDTGGYLLAWYDFRNGSSNADVYVQRLDGSLAEQWGANGLGVATQSFDEYLPVLAPDGQGGAGVAYLAAGTGVDLLAAKVSASGTVDWTGKTVSNASGDQTAPTAAIDAKGGLLVAFEDDGRSGSPDIYAQDLTSTGSPVWQDNGVPVAATLYAEQAPALVPDGSGGAVVAWEDWRDINGGQIYAQRIRDASTTVDTTPPTTPAVDLSTGMANNKATVTASWSSSDPESGISGYEYAIGTTSGGTDVAPFTSAGTSTSVTLPTSTLADGTYYVTVRATNGAGLTSTGTSGALVMDSTPPSVAVTAPAADAFVRGNVAVSGSATDAHFQSGTLAWGAGASPSSYTTIATLSSPVTSGDLGTWNTSSLAPGVYTLRLSASDLAGNMSEATRTVTVYIPGDVDGDGAVTVKDAALILQVAAGLQPATPAMLAAGDIAPKPSAAPAGYGNGVLDVADAARVMRAVNSLDTLP